MTAIDLRLRGVINLRLLPLLEGKVALTLALFFALDAQVDVALHLTYEHFAIVALRSHKKIAEILNFAFRR